MNQEQHHAAKRLSLALENCHNCGLEGEVRGNMIYVWPADAPAPQAALAAGAVFEDAAKKYSGCRIRSSMKLG